MSPNRRKNPLGTTAFLDILLNALGTFITLFILAFTLIRTEQPKKQDQAGYAEGVYRITLTWPEDTFDDVDLWMRDPQGNIVFFRRHEAGLMYLGRDDLGGRNDTIIREDGRKEIIQDNSETIILRGTLVGEYIVNVHLYNMTSPSGVPTTVTLYASATNGVIIQRLVKLHQRGDEKTAFRFSMNSTGAVTGTNQMPYPLAIETLRAVPAPSLGRPLFAPSPAPTREGWF